MTADPTGTAPTSVALAVVVDRSGSMHSIAEDAEGGVNAFVAEQRAQPGGGRLLLTQFDDAFDVVVDWVPLEEAPEYSLAPRGRTALLDAWGRTVVLLEERLETTPVGERPERVVVVVVTDGLENASVDWTRKGVEELTRRKQERDGWQFVFLAAGQDAIATASALGVPAGGLPHLRRRRPGHARRLRGGQPVGQRCTGRCARSRTAVHRGGPLVDDALSSCSSPSSMPRRSVSSSSSTSSGSGRTRASSSRTGRSRGAYLAARRRTCSGCSPAWWCSEPALS
ncbi:MAG: hypothetical protein PGN11_19885 [Quadrisphaera sp.]